MSANEIYTILVRECGATDGRYDRRDFIAWYDNPLHKPEAPMEWRFQGQLGFGGKFYDTRTKRYVSCYREDETPERMAAIAAANEALA